MDFLKGGDFSMKRTCFRHQGLYRRHFIFILLLLFTIPDSATPGTIKEILESAQSGGAYLIPEKNNLTEAERLFFRMFNGERDEAVLQNEWGKLHFNIILIHEEGKTFFVLHEDPSHKKGRGFYLFALSLKGNTILQMPHSIKDIYTGDIGLKMAKEGQFIGAAWNTIPRNYKEKGTGTKADLSDLFQTYLASFTRAFAESYPEGYVVQLHGFSKKRRETPVGKDCDIIISNGTKRFEPWLLEMDRYLEHHVSKNVCIFPVEVKELGATQTSVGIILHTMGHAGFLHIEMSRPLRSLMREESQYRKSLIQCMEEVFP